MHKKEYPAHDRNIAAMLTSNARKLVAAGIVATAAAGLGVPSSALGGGCPSSSPGGHFSGPWVFQAWTLPNGNHYSALLNGHYSAALPAYNHCSHANS